jgi:4-hydroxy-tetrahydrodipicolinate reductase
MDLIKVIVYGCGVMGQKITESLLSKKSFSIVGALDIAPWLVGKDLGAILDKPRKLGINIADDPPRLLAASDAHAVILTTTSRLKDVYPQIVQCVKAGFNVVSTCEELSFPWKRETELAQEIDQLAKKQGVTVVGTGINPGFLMDTLPLILTAPCLEVKTIRVIRMMDSSKRRIPFQKKIGTGLSLDAFRERIDNKVITGHVGLLESVNMIASGLGWNLDQAVELSPEPVIAEREIDTALGRVMPGNVIGLISIAHGIKDGEKIIILEFCAHAGVEEEYDEVIIRGVPDVHQRIIGGIHGDTGTVAVTINTIPRAVASEAGLIVMKDLPPVLATA